MNAIMSSKWSALPVWDSLLRRLWRRWESAVNTPWPLRSAAAADRKGFPELITNAIPSAVKGPLQGATISLPWPRVLELLPVGFLAGGTGRPPAGILVTLPLADVLPQLSSGKVRISLGKLRRAAPAGVIASTHPEAEETLIDLPLAEILARLNPVDLTPSAESVPAAKPTERGAAGISPLPASQEIAPEVAPRFIPSLQAPVTSKKLPPTQQEMLVRQAASENKAHSEHPEAPARIALL